MKKTILIIGITMLTHSIRLFEQSTYQPALQKESALPDQTVSFSISHGRGNDANGEPKSGQACFSASKESGRNY